MQAIEGELTRLAEGPLAQHRHLAEQPSDSESESKPLARERLLEQSRALLETRQRLLRECLDARVCCSLLPSVLQTSVFINYNYSYK